jgi:sortase A
VYVIDHGGSKLHFVVTDIKTYPYTDGPVEQIFNADDAARLNLITCAGTWVSGSRTYNERLVVYTTYKDSMPPASAS